MLPRIFIITGLLIFFLSLVALIFFKKKKQTIRVPVIAMAMSFCLAVAGFGLMLNARLFDDIIVFPNATTVYFTDQNVEAVATTATMVKTTIMSTTPDTSEISTEKSEKSTTAHKASTKSADPLANAAQITKSGQLSLISAPATVKGGSKATVSVQGVPGTEYAISVYYSAGKSTAAGLGPAKADNTGKASWTWRVGAKTKKGVHYFTVSGGGDEIKVDFTVD